VLTHRRFRFGSMQIYGDISRKSVNEKLILGAYIMRTKYVQGSSDWPRK